MKAGDKLKYDKPNAKAYRNGQWEYELMRYDVRVMAVADGYAMVRRRGCIPFTELVKNLEKWAVSDIEGGNS